jgi:hypothetical protein
MSQVFWDCTLWWLVNMALTSQIIYIFSNITVRTSDLSKNKITLWLCFTSAVNAISTDLIITVLLATWNVQKLKCLWTDPCVFSCPRLALALWPMCFAYIPFLRQQMIAAALFHSFLTKAMKACCEWPVWLTKLQWAVNKGTSSAQKCLLQQRIYFTLLSSCYIFFGWITHCQSVILFFKTMLKLTKNWKLTKFYAPSAAFCVASIMVDYEWGGIPDYRPQNNIREE